MGCALLMLLSFSLNAQKIYYANPSGNDANAGTQDAPFKTMGKINSLSLSPGDKVFFTGEFQGTLTTKSGVTYSSYNGRAILTGFQTPSLTSAGNGLFTATVTQCNVVTVDGVFQPMGKTALFTVSSHGTNSITGSGVPSCPNGEIVWRPYHWVLWRGSINSQSGSTVNYTPFPSTSGGPTEDPQNGYGFFLQNHPSLCTSFGQWACNSGKLTINLGSSHVVKTSSIDAVVIMNGVTNVTLDNLTIQGGNSYGISMNGASVCTINNCDVSFNGLDGIFGNGTCPNNKITNCNLTYNNSDAIKVDKGDAWIVTGNTIDHNGFYAGMGGSGEGEYIAVRDIKNGAVFEYNHVTNSGYLPLTFQGTNNTIAFNYIDTFCTIKDDGGGIYCGGSNSSKGTKIFNNIVINGIGAHVGTTDPDQRAHGIYVDDGGNNLEIYGNILAYNGGGGINLHNAHEINIHDNLAFDNKVAQIIYYNDGNITANNALVNNIFFAKGSELVYRSSGGSASPKGFFTASNSFTGFPVKSDNNFWCRPSNENGDFQTFVPSGSYNLAQWRSFTGMDANSKTTPAGFSNPVLIFNKTSVANTQPSGYSDFNGVAVTSLQPYTGKLVTGTVITPPPPTTFSSVSKSGSFTRNDCLSGTTPGQVTYSVPAGKYTSTVSQADADSKATNDVNANGQAFANTNGTCTPIILPIYYSSIQSGSFTRNNCQSGIGSTVTYTVSAKKYTSTTSQAAADSQASHDVQVNGQNYANANGVCNPVKKCNWWQKLWGRCK